MLYQDKLFKSDSSLYDDVEYLIFKRADWTHFRLKLEAYSDLLVEQQMRIKQLEA